MRTYTANGKEVTLNDLNNWIKNAINLVNDGYSSQYLTVLIEEELDNVLFDGRVKLRVSDHSGRHQNNNDYTLSFITARCDQGYDSINCEWKLLNEEEMLTDTYEKVSDILEFELEENVKLEEY